VFPQAYVDYVGGCESNFDNFQLYFFYSPPHLCAEFALGVFPV
jgi:hypothetical protein